MKTLLYLSCTLISLLVFYNTDFVDNFILRLPCRRHANFSVLEKDTVLDITPSSTIMNLNRTQCVLHCVANDDCACVNYEESTQACELLNSWHVNRLTKAGWIFLSPDYFSGVSDRLVKKHLVFTCTT